ncbi:MAG: UDP-N-acetylmuramyl-tripeptide synthetase [Candidatus Kerfeldbacteria bacterium]|nr:UDP-N-acetylmuramyl-tripeptide synthetase [Candidatus Kerfeldbacteria bacterium]
MSLPTSLKELVKKLIPRSSLLAYHRAVAWLAATLYGNPSRKMIVVGVTGTKGKSTTSNVIWHVLTQAGFKVGLTGTVNYRIADKNCISPYKMTMVGRFKLQKMLRDMVRAGCTIAVVETTSEGIMQHRHRYIAYDVCVLTNLSPEHLEAHGGFENYKQAKLELFRHLERLPRKTLRGKVAPRASVINLDNEFSADFMAVGTYPHITIGTNVHSDICFQRVVESLHGIDFVINDVSVHMPLLGKWNAYNGAVAVGVARALELNEFVAITALSTAPYIPGRMEFINEGQNFSVIVDYAYEPVSLELLYQFGRKFVPQGKKLITLISSTGGGRDTRRRPLNGKLAAQYCDEVIVTNEDPYEEDPEAIMNAVFEGVKEGGKGIDNHAYYIVDRREAISKAFELAREGDIVFLTAKGAEQKMCVAGGSIPWDDRAVAREVLRKILTN